MMVEINMDGSIKPKWHNEFFEDKPKMTEHTKEDVEALKLAAEQAEDLIKSIVKNSKSKPSPLCEVIVENLNAALAKFAPKPDKVYVLPSWDNFLKQPGWEGKQLSMPSVRLSHHVSIGQDEYNALRELTATDAPAQKWNMPEATPQWWLDISRTLWFDGKNSDEYEPHDSWKLIRELTATTAAEQKWNMPTLQQINEICGQPYGTAPTNALDTWYEAIRNKIMSLS